MTFIIERNVPIPEASFGKKRGGKWTSLALAMTVGDSVLLKDDKQARTLYQAIRKAGGRASQRKVNQTEDGKTWDAYRVWRTK